MSANHQLVRPSSTGGPRTIIKAFEQASQLPSWHGILHAIAQDKRQDLAPHVVTLWTIKLAKYPDADIAQVLTEGQWKFFPSIDEVIADLEALADHRRLQREEERNRAEQADMEAARKYWAEHPEEREEVSQRCREIEQRVAMAQFNLLAHEPPRSPRNVIALSQAKILRDLPPKKQPHSLPANAGEAPRQAVSKVKVAKIPEALRSPRNRPAS
ncbi:MAG: hypothetical protein JWO19_4390 [Bryobacterales bacterium]|nr:hypothetical protein [Bryobacterales bacterium]